jgi:excisionase family DNA binding protein
VCALDLPIHDDAERDVAIAWTADSCAGDSESGRSVGESSGKFQTRAKFQVREGPTQVLADHGGATMPKPISDTTRPRTALIDLPAVAERLGVNERHVRRLVAERRIPFLKWGHLLRFDPDEIDEWLQGARVRVPQ